MATDVQMTEVTEDPAALLAKKWAKFAKTPPYLILAKLRPGEVKYTFEKTSCQEPGKEFLCRAELDNRQFEACGATRQAARSSACKATAEYILSLPPPDNLDELLKKKKVNSDLPRPGTRHPIQLLEELEPSVQYQQATTERPANLHVYAACLDGVRYLGVGLTEASAKADAARNVLSRVYNYNYPDSGIPDLQYLLGDTTAENRQSNPIGKLMEMRFENVLFTDTLSTGSGTESCVQVSVDGKLYSATGATKKLAKANSAALALSALWGYDPPPMLKALEHHLRATHPDIPMCISFESGQTFPEVPEVVEEHVCNKLNRLRPYAVFSDFDVHGTGPMAEYSCSVQFDNQSFSGTARTKRVAKAAAAQAAVNWIAAQGEDTVLMRKKKGPSKPSNQNSTCEDKEDAVKELMKQKGSLRFQNCSSSRPQPNIAVFVEVEGRCFTGEGNSKKEAQRVCAENALSHLLPAQAEVDGNPVPSKRARSFTRVHPSRLQLNLERFLGSRLVPVGEEEQRIEQALAVYPPALVGWQAGGAANTGATSKQELSSLEEPELLKLVADPSQLLATASDVCCRRVHLLQSQLQHACLLLQQVSSFSRSSVSQGSQSFASAAVMEELERRRNNIEEQIKKVGTLNSASMAPPTPPKADGLVYGQVRILKREHSESGRFLPRATANNGNLSVPAPTFSSSEAPAISTASSSSTWEVQPDHYKHV